MNFTIDKRIVSKRFEKSIISYNSEARVQKNIVKELVLGIKNYGRTSNYYRVLEIGCGTGFLTHEFLQSFRPVKYVLNDLSASMRNEIEKVALAHCFTDWKFMAGDAEQTAFPGEFDLVLSASAFHWFHDIELFLSSISRSVRKGGMLAFSTFGPENFTEIKAIHPPGLNYPSTEDLVSWLTPSFRVIQHYEKIVSLFFTSPYSVLEHIRLTGANGVGTVCWNKQTLTDFETRYCQDYSTPDGMVRLTYHPIIIIASKK